MRFLLNYEIHSASFIPASPYFLKKYCIKIFYDKYTNNWHARLCTSRKCVLVLLLAVVETSRSNGELTEYYYRMYVWTQAD